MSEKLIRNKCVEVLRDVRVHRLYLGVRGRFLDYSVAARGAPHQTDPLPGKPAGDLPLPELLGMTNTHLHTPAGGGS